MVLGPGNIFQIAIPQPALSTGANPGGASKIFILDQSPHKIQPLGNVETLMLNRLLIKTAIWNVGDSCSYIHPPTYLEQRFEPSL